eukprot:Pgem_evm1s10235
MKEVKFVKGVESNTNSNNNKYNIGVNYKIKKMGCLVSDKVGLWYFFYQPVSYSLNGRMGSRDDLRTLIKTCRSMGVRVYADAVINHMTGGGNDMGEHRNNAGSCVTWGNKSSTNVDGPSPFYSQNFAYKTSPNTGKPMSQEYPAA